MLSHVRVSEECLCDVDWESALGEGHKFLNEVSHLVWEGVEFGFLRFRCEWVSQNPVASVAVVAVLCGVVVEV